MLKTIALVVVVAIVAVLAYAATRPDSFSISRGTVIQAPPQKIAGFIDDFHRWGDWSPWEKMDPQMQRTHSGAARGPGAVYAWTGDKVGAGRMEITEASPARVLIQLDFEKPMKAHNTAEFTLRPEGAGTRVDWTMRGASPYMSKLFGVFVDMDKMIGKDFEAGLASLKTAAEKP